MNVASLAVGHPDETVAVHDLDVHLRWGEVRHAAAAVAAGLGRLGVGAGDRVAIVWPTSADFVVAYLGVLAAGAVAVPMNPSSPAPELLGQLHAVEPSAVLAVAQAAEVFDTGDDAPVPVVFPGGSGDRAWESFAADPASPAFAPVERQLDDVAVLLFTSGTAASPRAAMLTHGNLLANLHQMLSVPGEMVRADDVVLAAVPLFHVFGLNVALGLSLATGATMVLLRRFEAAESLRVATELGVTLLVGVPPMFSAWADVPAAPAALGRVRRALSGAAPLQSDVAERFERRWGIPLWQGYGLTEAAPAVATSLGTGRHEAGSVGRPLPGVEVRLVDDAGDDVLEGDPGEIWVRGPNVFAGYWRDPDATAAARTEDGWLRTGDVGVVGEVGDLHVVDRKKDLVIVSGFNVYPAEVESVIATLDGVVEVVVVGQPDPGTGETVEAVVVARPGRRLTAADVLGHCAARLARYKCPTSVRFVDELPRGLHGKALRRAVQPPSG